jgi:hypothetical protein
MSLAGWQVGKLTGWQVGRLIHANVLMKIAGRSPLDGSFHARVLGSRKG